MKLRSGIFWEVVKLCIFLFGVKMGKSFCRANRDVSLPTTSGVGT